MDKINEDIEPELDEVPQVKGPSVLINKKSRPEIEGITVPAAKKANINPKAKPTPAEQKLVSENGTSKADSEVVKPPTKITLPPHKRKVIRTTVFVALILAIIIFGALGAYTWYVQKPGKALPRHVLPMSDFPVISPTPSQASTATTSTSTIISTANSTSSTSTIVSAPPLPQVKISSTPTGYLNVRQSPSSSAAVVTQVHPGEIYFYVDSKNGWYEITLPSGQSGWVSGQYAVKQ